MAVENEIFRDGLEQALELAITELECSKTREDALAKLYSYLGQVKNKKLDELKESLFCSRGAMKGT